LGLVVVVEPSTEEDDEKVEKDVGLRRLDVMMRLRLCRDADDPRLLLHRPPMRVVVVDRVEMRRLNMTTTMAKGGAEVRSTGLDDGYLLFLCVYVYITFEGVVGLASFLGVDGDASDDAARRQARKEGGLAVDTSTPLHSRPSGVHISSQSATPLVRSMASSSSKQW
jgi:hypothetical protein